MRSRVLSVLAVAKRFADPHDRLGIAARERLRQASALAPQGLELALGHYLETSATEHELEHFVRRAGRSQRCAVVLSANVCTAPVRAIAFALATAEEVLLKPSRRDPVLAELLARELDLEIVADVAALARRLEHGDEVHVYGRDETIAWLRPRFAHCTLRAHGAGFGVAVIGAKADLVHAAGELARDLIVFDGRGCLSPRIALVAGDLARANAFATAAHRALLDHATTIPRGPLDPSSAAEILHFTRAFTLIGNVFGGEDHFVALDPAPEAIAPPPAHRGIVVAPASPATVGSLLEPWARHLCAVGTTEGEELVAIVRSVAPRARVMPLGSMQRPPFDGPVDLRTLGHDVGPDR